jgi:hypothetical protein
MKLLSMRVDVNGVVRTRYRKGTTRGEYHIAVRATQRRAKFHIFCGIRQQYHQLLNYATSSGREFAGVPLRSFWSEFIGEANNKSLVLVLSST